RSLVCSFANPDRSISNEYGPGCSEVKTTAPDAGVTSDRASWMSVRINVTVAPGTGCPDSSTTRPVIVPLELWARTGTTDTPTHTRTATTRNTVLIAQHLS